MKLKVLLKSLVLVVFFWAIVLKGSTQRNYFIYIQADNKQPFYLVMNQKKLNSSPIGYLIVPKLTPDEYKVQLGFPDNQFPEQEFVIKIDKKDAGYALKKFDNGWGLFNFQTMDIIMGKPSEKVASAPTENGVAELQPKTVADLPPAKQATGVAAPAKNVFGEMLSDAMNDPDLANSVAISSAETATATTVVVAKAKPGAKGKKQPPVTKPKETTKKEPEIAQTKTENVPVSIDTLVPVEQHVNTQAAINETYDAAGTKGVIKLSEQGDEKGTDMVFVDFNSKGSDTIRLFIPAELSETADSTDSVSIAIAKPQEEKKVTEEKKAYDPNEKPFLAFNADSTAKKVDSGGNNVNNPFFDKSQQPDSQSVAVESEKPKDKKADSTVDTQTTSEKEPVKASGTMVNNECKKMASDEDMTKWKKKMISADGDKGMLQVIKKMMSGKCLTTDQVKELGGLFLSDEGRYNFFDEAYLYTYDFGKYPLLENQLFDSYYKKRFKAILRYQ